ncbi:MAG TPA: iron donor protein CyaY [Polyangiaceae bacterium]|nr:iron donor protein CyaY [Polyangiaceae bacterium]
MANSPLSETEFGEVAAAELSLLRDALDLIATGVEAELAGDILSVEFDDDSVCVINSHTAARQIWMAADRNAWHFDYIRDGGSWVASKSGDELWGALQQVLQRRLGPTVSLVRKV